MPWKIFIHLVAYKSTLIAKFMGPTWGRQNPGGPHVDHMNLAIWECQ